MTCKKCIHFNECAKDGITKYYGEEFAANNVDKLCSLFFENKVKRLTMLFRGREKIMLCEDIARFLEEYENYKIISTNMAINADELYVLIFLEREAANG